MRVISWNVAGLRSTLNRGEITILVEQFNPDILCLQETKAEETQVSMPDKLTKLYPYRYWESTKGTTQRKGLSGTAIWSKTKPIRQYNPPDCDEEGRIVTLEFPNFIIVCVYTPNSQHIQSERLIYRTTIWHENFKEYINSLKHLKPTIICGDLNVANEEIDIHNPNKHHQNAGFLDIERKQFKEYLELGFEDALRIKHPNAHGKYTYWNNLNPKIRLNNSGWRIDYFLTTNEIKIEECDTLPQIIGSDHCPLYLDFKRKN